MAIATVAVYSDADAKALHVRQADEAVHIGPSPAAESYLRGETIIEAAKATGIHEMVLRLPNGYDTQVGASGKVLSGGQRQRVGLARALYGMPAVVVLDEPNSHLDDVGERALVAAMQALKAAGRTVVLISHRTHILSVVDRIVVLRDGRVAHVGLRDEVLPLIQPPAVAAA